MKQFKYTAVNLQKEKFQGLFIAKDERDLALQLSKQDLFLISCTPYSGKTPSAFFTLGTGKVTIGELNTFCRQFAIMTSSGLSLLATVDILRKQQFTQYFKSILDVIYEDVKAGVMLSDAVDKHAKVFPDFFRSMMRVGEASGKMDLVFNSLADYYEKDADLRSKAKSALTYPLVLIVLTVAVFFLMMFYVVPTFKESLSSLEVTPNGISKVVFDMSGFLLTNWRYVLLIIITLGLGIFGFSLTEKGKYFFDWLKVNFPLLKKIQIDLITARFSRAFGLLLSSGLDIVQSLDIIKVIIGNRYLEKKFAAATEEVRVGVPLSVAIEKYKIFPNILIQLLSVGEKTATLETVMERSYSYFDTQAESTITSVTNIIQPVILCIMGLVVGSMFIAIYSPMISIMESF